MRIGVPKEIKRSEFRVGMTPSGVGELVASHHEVWVETGAGVGAGFDDGEYARAGAKIVGTAEEAFSSTDLVVKVKEPQLEECARLSPGQTLFTD